MAQRTDTLRDLARTVPAASRVFHRYRLDFCCGGAKPLGDVCAERGLDPDALLAQIESESKQADGFTRWDERTPGELVQHILDTYHAPLRPEIARLREMTLKVESVHAEKGSCPRGLAAHLDQMSQAVDDHLTKEEQILFPMIVAGNFGYVRMPIQVMLHEHDDHAEALRRTRTLTNDLVAPEEACTTWRALYLGLEQLERDLMDHIHLENNVLFPMVLNS
jgi:regulator of cell morphogenesis and NO signaling